MAARAPRKNVESAQETKELIDTLLAKKKRKPDTAPEVEIPRPQHTLSSAEPAAAEFLNEVKLRITRIPCLT